ncbi:DUF2798 domain-containing protein [Radiobacillus deserti]|uniref:DUF2798 domain-containing protein n=1 Tax=Radiobacillus deserti TaxID=2594883 RepID=A0A516KI65_9BACI|nr:DUF2798 domain-containing protein [Radiobacillus deserti]QDP41098.1 DUF2798 domain-containing protein [Radiobacillus deserti]
MPTTKREGLIFGIMMCLGMVLVMANYNLWLNDAYGHLSIGGILVELLIGFVIALLLDLFLVGPVAKALTFRIPFNKTNKLLFVLIMSTCMIIGMVLFMSIFGLITQIIGSGLDEKGILITYLVICFKNFIVAYPLQLIIMGPLVRFIFVRFVKKEPIEVTIG